RHTRWPRDWSSDVCFPISARVRGRIDDVRVRRVESDLANTAGRTGRDRVRELSGSVPGITEARVRASVMDQRPRRAAVRGLVERSEERRVGKECRGGWGEG